MAVVKNLMVRAGADFSALKKATDKAQKDLKRFKDSVNDTMSTIGATLAGLGIGFYLKEAVNDAMKFEASIQQLNRLMGDNAKVFVDWANESASSFNMSKSEAVQYGATFANIISTFAKGTKETEAYTRDLLKATAVAASMTGRSMEDALERIRSGMLGNTEAVEDLGIFVNVAMIESTKAFQKFANGKSWEQLDFRTKQTIRYFAILEQAATKYGVSVGNNAISSTAQFVAELNNLKLTIGQAFKPIWEAVLPALTSFARSLSYVMGIVAQFTQALFGKSSTKGQAAQTKQTLSQAGAVSDLGDAYKKAGKEAKGSIAGFDEVNQLADAAGSGGSGSDVPSVPSGGGVTLPTDEMGGFADATIAVSEKIQQMADKVKSIFRNMAAFIKDNKVEITSALAGIGAALATVFLAKNWSAIIGGISGALSKMAAGIRAAWVALTGPLGWLVLAIGAITAAFVYYYQTNEEFRGKVDSIFRQIRDEVVYLWNNVMIPFGAWLKDTFLLIWPYIRDAIGALIEYGLKPLASMIGGTLVDMFNTLRQSGVEIIDGLKTTFKGLITFITGIFAGDWKKAWEGIKMTFKGVFDTLWAIVKTPLNLIIDGVNLLIKGLNNISFTIPDIPGLPGAGKTFGIHIPKIPKLATGGITNGPMLAMIGDNPGGEEVVSPLDDLMGMIQSAVGTAMLTAAQFNNNQQDRDIVLQIDGTTIARVLHPYSSKESNRIGGAMITTT